jgi:hypothetical protein
MSKVIPPVSSMPLPNMDQLLEDASEHALFLPLMEGWIHSQHPVFGDNEFFLAELHNLKIL